MGRQLKILVADDMADGRYLLRSSLKGSGYELVEATDGISALEKLKSETFDLIISDVLMPKMDGFELCRECNRDGDLKSIPLIFYTSNYLDKKDESFALSLGAKAYLRKPMNPVELLENINRVISESKKTDDLLSLPSNEEDNHFLKEHNRRMVDKLTEKVLALELEIVAHKEAEESLSSSRRRYQALFDESPVPLWEEDFSELNKYLDVLKDKGVRDLRAYLDENPSELQSCARKIVIKDINHAALELHDAGSKEELIENLDKIFTAKSYDVFKEELIAIFTGQTEFESEAEVKTLAGELKIISLKLKIEDDKLKQGIALLATMDITRQKRVEEELQDSQGKLIDAQELAKIGYYVLNVSTGLWSNSYELDDIFGIDENFKRDVDGWLSILHPDYKEIMLNYLQDDVLTQHKKFRKEYKIVNRKRGEERWVHGLGTLKFDDNGVPVEMFGTIQDITDRKLAEEEAKREAETTKNLLRLSEATTRTDDIKGFMRNVVEITRDITASDMVMSYLWDGETCAFRPCEAAGLAHDMLPLFNTIPVARSDMTAIKDALDTGQIIRDCNMGEARGLKLQQELLFDWVDDAEMISMLPLVVKGEYLGLIACFCFNRLGNECSCLTNRKGELMQAVANHVSIALKGTLHYKESVSRTMELSQKVETIETMSEISKSILSTLKASEIIEVTARMVSRLVPCDWVRVIHVDWVNEEFRFMEGFEEGKELESVVASFSSTSLYDVVSTGTPQCIMNLRTLDAPLGVESGLIKQGFMSVLRVPIIVKVDVVAVLGLMSKRPSAFSPGNLSILDKLSNQVGVALENARLVTDLEELSLGTVRALSEAIDAKSEWTRGHSDRVTEIGLRIAREMNLSEKDLSDIKIGGLLHDIGKIGTYESILDKPDKLSKDEVKEMMKHTWKGTEILAPIKQLSHILPIIRGHHEAFDGTGYPDGLKGTDISLQARILTVADTVDAMGTDRPYRKALSSDDIVSELRRCCGTKYDPEVVDAYLKTLRRVEVSDEEDSSAVEITIH